MLNARHWPRVLRGGSVLGDSLLSCSHAGCNLGGGSVQVHLFLGFMITLGRSRGSVRSCDPRAVYIGLCFHEPS